MARKERVILVGPHGEVKEAEPIEVRQDKIGQITWLPEITGESITITFRGNVPFVGNDWDDKGHNGTRVTGKLKPHDSGQHPYFYDAYGWESDARSSRPHTTPDLIVDGGDGTIPPDIAAPKTKKTSRTKKTAKVKKAKKTAKSRASKKR